MKKCSKCNLYKSYDCFSKNGTVKLASGEIKSYYKSHCKECKKKAVKASRRIDKRQYLASKWQGMKERCETSKYYLGFSYPDKHEFIAWSLEQGKFHKHYKEWVKSGYNMQYSPSIDRIDVNRGYEFDNMQFIPFRVNSVKDRKVKVVLVSPEGSLVEHVGVSDFCKKYNIAPCSVHRLRTGKIESCKGWRLP